MTTTPIVLAHGTTTHLTDVATTAGAVVTVGACAVYVMAANRLRDEPRGWSLWRTASFVAGTVLLVVALVPSTSDDLTDHMAGHLLLGMYAPLFLALSAPMTLFLRSVRPSTGRRAMRLVRSGPARVLTHPVILLSATVGGLVVLYFTPLFTLSETQPTVHALVHLHFFVSGYLFSWMIAGADPAPDRPSVPARLVILGVAILGHAVVAQLIHAGLFVSIEAPAAQLRAAGNLMYYWGDIAEILLALAMLQTWRVRQMAGRQRNTRPGNTRPGNTRPATGRDEVSRPPIERRRRPGTPTVRRAVRSAAGTR